ncbi:MAG: YkgJ family cysteine cluster protein [Desulfofustis sp.]|nr:YkgJ family cysteine cluster protein [Desulfofustis sp.]
MSRNPLPHPDPSLCSGYRQLIAEIDLAVSLLIEKRFVGLLHCRPGCTVCCTAFRVLPLEAALLRRAMSALEALPAIDDDRCRLLHEECCRIYEHRPIICRTQGLPIAYIDEAAGKIEVSACPLNFADDYLFVHEDLLFLDHFNNRLAELNRRYCRTAAIDPELRLPINLLGSTR